MRRRTSVAGADKSPPRLGVAPALPVRNRHPGGVGAPPGDTTIPCQELADVDVWSFAAADARLWNGADTGARSPRRLKARNNRTSAKCAARRRRCSSQLPTGFGSGQSLRKTPRWSAGRRSRPPSWPVIPNGMDPLARRVTGCARFAHQRLRALHLPSPSCRGEPDRAEPGRMRAAGRTGARSRTFS
jgi:hypothetical protein